MDRQTYTEAQIDSCIERIERIMELYVEANNQNSRDWCKWHLTEMIYDLETYAAR